MVTGVMEEECESQMEEFMHWCRSRGGRLVTLKASTDTNGLVDGPQDQPSEIQLRRGDVEGTSDEG